MPATLHAFDKSAGKLGVEQIDLLILHQPLPTAFDRTIGAYKALETLLAEGKVRAIGVANFLPEYLEPLLEQAEVLPAVNQIEVHPYFTQTQSRELHSRHGILTQAWSPMGGITSYRQALPQSTFENPTILDIAQTHGKSAPQVMLRWHFQQGRSAIPKSARPERIVQNFDIFDFELSTEDLVAIDALDTGVRGGPEPADVNLENFDRTIPEA